MNDTLERTDIEVIEGVDLKKELMCETCGAPADWRLSMKCCGESSYKCDECMKKWREIYDRQSALRLITGHITVNCGMCGHSFGRIPYRDAITENRIRG